MKRQWRDFWAIFTYCLFIPCWPPSLKYHQATGLLWKLQNGGKVRGETKSLKCAAMANLDCQLNFIWNKIKPRLMGTPVKNSLDYVICCGKTYPESGPYLLVAANTKRGGKRKLLLFTCLFLLLLATLSALILWSVWNPTYLGQKNQWFSRNYPRQ